MHQSLKIFLLAILSFNFSQAVLCQEVEKTTVIISTGSGNTQEESKLSALRSAIEQACGVYISSSTEVLNNILLSDQIISQTSGNFKSYEVLNETQLGNNEWVTTLRAIISVSNLTSFVQSKGFIIDVSGGALALNIKQQLLNEQAEIRIVSEMLEHLHEPMQISFDYKMQVDEPKSSDENNLNWEVKLHLKIEANKNLDACANYFIKTLESIALKSDEIERYRIADKLTYPVSIEWRGASYSFNLRKENSVRLIQTFTNQWFGYLGCFRITLGEKKILGADVFKKLLSQGNTELRVEPNQRIYFTKWTGGGGSRNLGWVHNFYGNTYIDFSRISHIINGSYEKEIFAQINFPSSGEIVGDVPLTESLTLNQIETLSNISISPAGVISQIGNGGIIFHQKNGITLVMSLLEFGYKNWKLSKSACDSLTINGYSDWYLPSKDELQLMAKYYDGGFGFGGFHDGDFWSNTLINNNYHSYPVFYRVYLNPFKVSDYYDMEYGGNMYARPIRMYKLLNIDTSKMYYSTPKDSIVSNGSSLLDTFSDSMSLIKIKVASIGLTKDEAINAALRSALQQTYGAFLSSKTDIFNNQLMVDKMTSISSGNIHSFEVISEYSLPNGGVSVALNAEVSLNKFTTFVKANGVDVQIKGGVFARNIKQQLINEKGEVDALYQMVGFLHKIMPTSFDYNITNSDPKSNSTDDKVWLIPLSVTATTNENINFCFNYFISTLSGLSLTSEELETYQSLNKKLYKVVINYNDTRKIFFLRKKYSFNLVKAFIANWEFYLGSFIVNTNLGESNVKWSSKINYLNNNFENDNEIELNLVSSGHVAAVFSGMDKRLLTEIEKIKEYKVNFFSDSSQFNNGGFVLFEKNGHGVVFTVFDLGKTKSFIDAQSICANLDLNGYKDWRLPTKEELDLINKNYFQKRVGSLKSEIYWGIDLSAHKSIEYIFAKDDDEKWRIGWRRDENTELYIRAVRSF